MAALGQLTATIAHEINTPIGVVSSAADNFERCVNRIVSALQNGRTLDEVRSDRGFQMSLDAIQENSRITADASRRIAKIVNGLKAFSPRDETGPRSADVREGIESSLALMRHHFRDKVQVSTKYGDVPLVPCNSADLNQVFVTLLTNAVQAVEGAGEITIETSLRDDNAHVKISDTGKGIPQNKLDSLFDFSFTTKGSRVGVGMGLPTAYSIIRKYNGHINVSSEVARGTEFEIALPLRLVTAN